MGEEAYKSSVKETPRTELSELEKELNLKREAAELAEQFCMQSLPKKSVQMKRQSVRKVSDQELLRQESMRFMAKLTGRQFKDLMQKPFVIEEVAFLLLNQI